VLESYEGLAIAFNLHFDTTAVVGHESTQIQPGGEGVDERPEADALHDADDLNSAAFHASMIALCATMPVA
jgi:hypothetical protein